MCIFAAGFGRARDYTTAKLQIYIKETHTGCAAVVYYVWQRMQHIHEMTAMGMSIMETK